MFARRFAPLLVVLMFALLSFNPARAQYITPEGGWYWNPAASGSGFNLEFQDSVMTLSFFAYNAARQPTFFTMAGVLNVATGRVDASLIASNGGQCIGCSYSQPTNVVVGPAAVQFTSQSTAQVTLPVAGGGFSTISVQRFVYAYGPTQNEQRLGAWFTTIAFPTGLPEGDILRVRRVENFGGSLVATGDLYPAGRVLAGGSFFASGTSYNYAIVIDFSAVSNAAYIGEYTVNGFRGEYFLYPKGSTPIIGTGIPTFGARLAGPNTANQVLGLNAVVNAATLDDTAKRRTLMSEGKANGPSADRATQAAVDAVIRQLEFAMLEAKRRNAAP